MKNRATLRQELGITQEEMAILLNMKRSHMAMYESGERELPSSALTILYEIQMKLQSPEAVALKSEWPPEAIPEQQQQLLIQLLRKNQFQQMKLARAISALEEKQQAHTKAWQLGKCLTEGKPLKNLAFPGILDVIKIRATSGLAIHNANRFNALCVQRDLLVHEEVWLKAAIKKESLS